MFAGGQVVAPQRSVREVECSAEERTHSHSVAASWLDDGSLARYQTSTPETSRTWDSFSAATAAGCSMNDAPPASEVQALSTELRRIREAFLRP